MQGNLVGSRFGRCPDVGVRAQKEVAAKILL